METGTYLGGWLHEVADHCVPVLLEDLGNAVLFSAVNDFMKVQGRYCPDLQAGVTVASCHHGVPKVTVGSP
jgi:hypothetical protein